MMEGDIDDDLQKALALSMQVCQGFANALHALAGSSWRNSHLHRLVGVIMHLPLTGIAHGYVLLWLQAVCWSYLHFPSHTVSDSHD
jgi:hypothetical protein